MSGPCRSVCSPSAATAAVLALSAAGCKTTVDDITGSVAEPRAPQHRGRMARRARDLGQPLPRQSRRRQGRHRLCQGAARHRPARPGGGGAATGLDPQSAQHGAARRLWPRARRCRPIHRSARRARPRPHAGQSGLAHPQCAGRRARPDGPPRRGAAPLRDRAQDRAERAVGAVQSRAVLRARQEAAAGGSDLAAGGRRCPTPVPKVRQNLALVVGLQGRFAEAEKIAGADLPPDKPPPMSIICARCSRSKTIGKKWAGTCRCPTPAPEDFGASTAAPSL